MGQSRGVILVVVAALSLGIPAGVCLAFALVPVASWFDLAIACAAAAVWMTLLLLVNWWEFTGTWLRWPWGASWVALVLLRVIALRGVRPLFATQSSLRATSFPFISAPRGLIIAAALLAAAGVPLLARVLAARRHRGDSVELAFPVRAGRFLVTDGGDGAHSFLVNYHYGFGKHRASGVGASMRFAMDVVEVGRAGASCRGLLPRRNDAFRIWERALLAPCDGQVAHAVNDVRDNHAFGDDRPYGVGNHVVIRTGDDYVVLGHMRQGSVTVKAGQQVRAGDEIGRVGNSGWTERPHLHMQAMRSAAGDWWHGEPMPMRFGGRFLVRNQRFRA